MPTITVLPLGREIAAASGALLRDVLQTAGILLDYPCGGKGTCHQCRITVEPVSDDGIGGLKEKESANGTRLACQLHVQRNCTITIAEERMSAKSWRQGLRDEDIATAIGGGSVRRMDLMLSAPSLDDQRSDWERLQAGCGEKGIDVPPQDPSALEAFSRTLRENEWHVDALCEGNTLLWIVARSEKARYGFAVDLGTTTIDIALLDLETGERLARKAFLNGQVAFGADVVSRAQSFHDDRVAVRAAALNTIAEGAVQILGETGIAPQSVVKTVVVGNPIMIHILNDIDPYQLTQVPYIPVTNSSLRSSPALYGWSFQAHGYVETLPLISAYVGADTIAMIVALDLELEQKTSLSIDIGTNGEMVLARHGKLLATSTAAGPAFEGAQIACGMRALPGAILRVSIAASGAVDLSVVGEAAPRGICGTGLISGIAELLDRGVIDATGRIVDPAEVEASPIRERLFTTGNESAFALTADRSVYISQSDVRKLQLAKGAVRTGIETLLEVSAIPVEKLDALRLAGNFGAGLDARSAMRIGLIPNMDLAKVHVVGNAALRGAIMVLLSRECWAKSESASRNARFVELGGKPEFQNRFMDSMMF